MVGTARSASPDRTAVRRTNVRRRQEQPRSGTDRASVRWSAGRNAAAVGRDCAPRQDQRRGRWRRPLAVAAAWDRGRMCTRALRPAPAGPRRSTARSRRGRGCARSSRQTSAALVATGLDDSTPATRAHASTKAVLLGTTAVVGLVGALHAVLLGTREPDPVCDTANVGRSAAQRPKATVTAPVAATRRRIASMMAHRRP